MLHHLPELLRLHQRRRGPQHRVPHVTLPSPALPVPGLLRLPRDPAPAAVPISAQAILRRQGLAEGVGVVVVVGGQVVGGRILGGEGVEILVGRRRRRRLLGGEGVPVGVQDRVAVVVVHRAGVAPRNAAVPATVGPDDHRRRTAGGGVGGAVAVAVAVARRRLSRTQSGSMRRRRRGRTGGEGLDLNLGGRWGDPRRWIWEVLEGI